MYAPLVFRCVLGAALARGFREQLRLTVDRPTDVEPCCTRPAIIRRSSREVVWVEGCVALPTPVVQEESGQRATGSTSRERRPWEKNCVGNAAAYEP